MKSTRILCIRHGETDWNKEGRCQGHLDVPLNEAGHQQAAIAAQRLVLIEPQIVALYSSDLTRALQTAAPIAKVYGIDVVANPDLREAHQGEAQGLLRHEVKERFGAERERLNALYPDLRERWNYADIPGSEPRNKLLARLMPTLEQYARQHEGKAIVVVTHAGVIRTLVAHVGAEAAMTSLKFTNCLIADFQFQLNDARLMFDQFYR